MIESDRYTALDATELIPMRRLTLSLVPIIALAALAGCGQKGPLVRPTPATAPTAQPAPPTSNVPPPSSPDMNTLPIPDSGSGG